MNNNIHRKDMHSAVNSVKELTEQTPEDFLNTLLGGKAPEDYLNEEEIEKIKQSQM